MKFRPPAIAGAALALLLLAGCAPGGGGAVALGEPHEVTLSDDETSTDATVSLTVAAVEQESIEVLSDFNLDEEQLRMTPYLVRYSVELVEGSIGDYDMFRVPFVVTRNTVYLGAKTADGTEATPMLLIGGLDGCSGVSGEDLEAMSVGDTLEGCRVFLAESSDGMGEVFYGKSTWTVASE